MLENSSGFELFSFRVFYTPYAYIDHVLDGESLKHEGESNSTLEGISFPISYNELSAEGQGMKYQTLFTFYKYTLQFTSYSIPFYRKGKQLRPWEGTGNF